MVKKINAETEFGGAIADSENSPGRAIADSENPVLDALAGEADTLATPPGEGGEGAGPSEQAPAVRTNAQILCSMIVVVRDSVSIIADLKAPRATLTDDKVGQLGAIWGEVLDGYGFQLGAAMGKYGAVVLAIGASATILAPVVVATRAEILAKEAASPKAGAQEAPEAGAQEATAAPREGVIEPAWKM